MNIQPDERKQDFLSDLVINDWIELTHRESLRLLEMIENPPVRNENFIRAQARYARNKEENQTS